jgi:nucleoside-diphosphate-sugar epimerase
VVLQPCDGSMHTILGANGVIGCELSRLLAADGHPVRQVGRSPRAENSGDETFTADLLDPRATADAVAGSEVAYLVAGLKYDARVWADQWPRVMRNAIDACARHGTRLVFFDNVYAYGRVDGVMTEESPFNPCSRKGEVRARIATMLLDAIAAGEVRAMIVRAPDFYGPGATLSLTHAIVTERLRAGRTPQWVGNPKAEHTLVFTPDAARTVALLASREDAWGRTWHTLTRPEPITGEGFVRLACEVAGRPFRIQVAPGWLLAAMGLFMPVLRENREMMYQFEHPYRFDSRRTAAHLGAEATTYRDGLVATLGADA